MFLCYDLHVLPLKIKQVNQLTKFSHNPLVCIIAFQELRTNLPEACEHCTDEHPHCNEAMGSCYHISTTKMGVATGNDYCAAMGLYLVSVDSLEEFQYIQDIVSGCKLGFAHLH